MLTSDPFPLANRAECLPTTQCLRVLVVLCNRGEQHALSGISLCRYVTGPRMLVIFCIVRQCHGNGLQQQQARESQVASVQRGGR